MSLDRSKFKATSVAATVEQDKELAASLGRDGGNYTKYLVFEDGPNLLRIYPPHPEEDGGGDVFAEPKVTVFLPMMVPERDANRQVIMENGRPKLKESVKSVFNSRIHGDTPKDLVEEYISLALKRLEEALEHTQDPAEKAIITNKLNAVRGNYALKIQGLKYTQKWVMYVNRIVGQTHTFGPIEIGPAVKEALNKIAANVDNGEGAITTDPFTDIEDGRAVKVVYNKNATKPQDYYNVQIDSTFVKQVIAGQPYNLPRQFPLTDEQLEAFMKVTPLKKRFRGVFKRSDFKLQFEGLEFFDKKHQIGLFQDEEFLNIFEEIDAYYPEDEDEVNAENQSEGNVGVIDTSSNPVIAEEEYNGDMFELMDRKELGDWHRANKTGFLVKPTLTDEQIREAARDFLNSQSQEEEEEVVQEEVAEEQNVPETPSVKGTAQSRLAAMRAKTGVSEK